MENVYYMASFAGRNIAEEVAVSAEDLGYNVRYGILNAAWYGVPQMRERLFVIGLDARFRLIPTFPKRTHSLELPVGYTTSRTGRPDYIPVLPPSGHYVTEIASERELLSAVTAEEAIGDMPSLTFHLSDHKARKGIRRFDTILPYRPIRPNAYARQMREWPSFESKGGIRDHVIRYTPRDYETFGKMSAGDQYPQAFAIAEKRFQEALARMKPQPKHGTSAYESLYGSIVPPYDPNKFPNKWRKLEADRPARTIPAHIGKDSYSHIHYDSSQSRSISVREAARLQSFPDGFVFSGGMNAAFKQIGDSVPPLLAHAIADCLKKQLRKAHNVVNPECGET
jgi:DNA (cytosine-5)-methyltransferase 1